MIADASTLQTAHIYKTSSGSFSMASGFYNGGSGTTREFRVVQGNDLNSNIKFTVEQSGNVGINTISPSQKLEVNGSASVSGSMLIGDTNITTSSNGDVNVW